MKLASFRLNGCEGVLIGLAFSCVLSGCAVFDPDNSSDLVKAGDGWTHTDEATLDEGLINTAKQDGYLGNYIDDKKNYKLIWFHRGTDDFLIYLQRHAYLEQYGCDQETVEFKKDGNRWVEVGKHGALICVD